MTPGAHKPEDSLGGGANDEIIGRLINQYFDRRESGENLSDDDFIAEHPEYAEELREHLVGLELLDGLGSSSGRPVLPEDETAEIEGSSAKGQSTAASTPPPKLPGYEIHKLLGRGGMGLVYKASHIATKRQVALKVLLEGPLASEQARRRFEREIALAAQLRHPNIIPIYDSGTCDGRMFYAMEYVRGSSLSEHMQRHALDLRGRLRLFDKVCRAILHAHQRGVIHRDLKPSNILIDAEGEPHILDFGLAKAGTYADMTTSATAQIVGTPAYMSPEQAAGDPSGIDMRTDVYSLGVVLYEVLTGKLPYETNVAMGKLLENVARAEPQPPSRVDRTIDDELSAIVLKSLEKSKDERYQSLDALSSDICRYLSGDPISVKPASGFYLLKKAVWRHRRVVGATAILIFFAGAAALSLRLVTDTLEKKETQIRQSANLLEAQAAESARLKRDAEEAVRDRDRVQKELSAAQTLLERYDPTLARAINAVAGSLTDPYKTLPELLAEGASELGLENAEGLTKEPIFDPDAPQKSRVPMEATAEDPPLELTLSPELIEILRRLVPQKQPPPTTAPAETTTQPLTTRPADSGRPAAGENASSASSADSSTD